MVYPKENLDEGYRVIRDFVRLRLSTLKQEDKASLESEFKEWLTEESFDQDEIWTIPDLTDEGLCDFFHRAISQGK